MLGASIEGPGLSHGSHHYFRNRVDEAGEAIQNS